MAPHLLRILIALLPCCLATKYPSGYSDHTIVHGRRSREYIVHVPTHRQRISKGIVVFIHGTAQNGSNFCHDLDVPRWSDLYGFVGVCPSATTEGKKQWNAGRQSPFAETKDTDDLGFISSMLGEMQTELNAPRDKVFAMGFSNGGAMTNLLACELSNVIHGFGAFGMAFNQGKWTNSPHIPCEPAHPRPYWAGVGTVDGHYSESNVKGGWEEYSNCLLQCTGTERKSITRITKRSVTCYEPADCVGQTKFCAFDKLGHNINWEPFGMDFAPTVWEFLNNATSPEHPAQRNCISWTVHMRQWWKLQFLGVMIVLVPVAVFCCLCVCCYKRCQRREQTQDQLISETSPVVQLTDHLVHESE